MAEALARADRGRRDAGDILPLGPQPTCPRQESRCTWVVFRFVAMTYRESALHSRCVHMAFRCAMLSPFCPLFPAPVCMQAVTTLRPLPLTLSAPDSAHVGVGEICVVNRLRRLGRSARGTNFLRRRAAPGVIEPNEDDSGPLV